MKAKGIFLVIIFSIVSLLCHSQDISGKYYYCQSESNTEEVVIFTIEKYPIMALVLADSTQYIQFLDMLPKQFTVSNSKISMLIDGKEELVSNDVQIKKNGENDYTITFSYETNNQSDEITYSVIDKQKVINWHGLVYKTN